MPGVSRSGAALTAARLRGLSRPAAAALSLRAALPVTVGAGLLKGVRAARDGVPEELRGSAAVGAAAALRIRARGTALGPRHALAGHRYVPGRARHRCAGAGAQPRLGWNLQ